MASPNTSLLDRISLAGCLVAALFLCFLGGAWVVLAQVFPYPYLSHAYEGGKALLAKETEYRDPFQSDFWKPAGTTAKGVTRYDPAKAQPGLTLYTSGDEARAFLVAMDGEVVHEWQLPVQRGVGRNLAGEGPAARFVHLLA